MTRSSKIPSVIVVAPGASPPERLAARELCAHLPLLGVKARIAERAGGRAIHVGAVLLPPGARQALKKVRDDGFLLCESRGSVYVAGRMPRGTLFGCYRYLESLGIRWPEPGARAEVTCRTLAMAKRAVEGVDNPDMTMRGNFCFAPTNEWESEIDRDMVEWMTRQRYNLHSFLRFEQPALTGFDQYWYRLADFVHERGMEFALGTHLSWSGLLMYEDKLLFHKHPEYFPVREGRRQPSGLHGPQLPGTYGPDAIGAKTGSGMSVCASNPRVVEIITRNLRKFLDGHPEIDVMGMWTPDTKWEGCECPKCRKLVRPERMWGNSPYHKAQWRVTSDITAHLIGEVAARSKKTHPRVRILTWGWTTSEPAPQNVVPKGRFDLLAFYLPCFTHTFDSPACQHHHIHPEAWKRWAKTKNVRFAWGLTGAPGTAVTTEFPLAWIIKKNVEFTKRIGGMGVVHLLDIGPSEDHTVRADHTGHYHFAACGPSSFTLGRAGWSSDAPIEDLYADFAEARFGSPAASAMTQYYTQVIERYESWQHSQPLADFHNIFGASEVHCRPVWEAVVEIFTPAMIERARNLLAEALRAARDGTHRRRIRMERDLFEHTVLMREIYYLHIARQKLEEAGDAKSSRLLFKKQLVVWDKARHMPLAKHTNREWLDLMWLKKPGFRPGPPGNPPRSARRGPANVATASR